MGVRSLREGTGVPSLSGDCLAALGPATCRNGAEAAGGQSHGTCCSWNSEVWVHFQCGSLSPLCVSSVVCVKLTFNPEKTVCWLNALEP